MKFPERFVKKPVEVWAIQFDGKNFEAVHAFVGNRYIEGQQTRAFNPIGTYLTGDPSVTPAELWVEANQSVLPIEVGEWIIRDKLGFYPCKDSTFTDTYYNKKDAP